VIVNGGAALGISAIEEVSAEDFSRNLDINVVGPHRVIKAFVPFLKRYKAPRRVLAITSSAGGSLGFADQIWDMTKAATGQDFSPAAGYFATK
jgi:NAD(P)-dependent dehydrogenase (short-subunit alcohol dehydrogenase family)